MNYLDNNKSFIIKISTLFFKQTKHNNFIISSIIVGIVYSL
jgi:hypothetical protein